MTAPASPISPYAAERAGLPPDEVRSLGFGAGMGLPNMKKYADRFDIQSTVGVGTAVEMEVDF